MYDAVVAVAECGIVAGATFRPEVHYEYVAFKADYTILHNLPPESFEK